MRSTLTRTVLLAALFLSAAGANAATLNVVGGQLLGASGVIVDGSSYNVEFLDGTCIALYGGCDEVSDFTFQTQAGALLAAQALVDQVFLDGNSGLFASDPSLTFGCDAPDLCQTMIPYDVAPTQTGAGPGFDALGMLVNNHSLTAPFEIGFSGGIDYRSDTGPSGFFGSLVYAVWTPVPEPGTALLMGLGLGALSTRRRDAVADVLNATTRGSGTR